MYGSGTLQVQERLIACNQQGKQTTWNERTLQDLGELSSNRQGNYALGLSSLASSQGAPGVSRVGWGSCGIQPLYSIVVSCSATGSHCMRRRRHHASAVLRAHQLRVRKVEGGLRRHDPQNRHFADAESKPVKVQDKSHLHTMWQAADTGRSGI